MASKMDVLLNAVKKAKSSSGGDRGDKKFYYPARDQAGNGSATIRFLPGKTDDEVPFVKIFSHGFKGPTGKWFIEECPTTIEQPCFCCEQNSAMVGKFGSWDTTPKDIKEVVRERKRKISYISNILVVKDEKNPENEGLIFQYKFGTKIFDKIVDTLQPEFVDEDDKEKFVEKFGAENCNVFDLVEGANFKIKIRKVDGQTNYDKSEFEKTSKVKVDLSTLESLEQFLLPARFSSPEDLERQFNKAVGNIDRVAKRVEPEIEDEPEVRAAPKKAKVEKVEVKSDADDEDEVLAMMRAISDEEVSIG